MNKEIEDKYGPQSAGDNVFTRKARLLQSMYRLDKLEEKEFGVGPNKNAVDHDSWPTHYGNILKNGGESGKNFFYKETFKYAIDRVKNKISEETLDVYRLFNNMLSSMPMAFNLFHPLMMIKEKDSKALTKMIAEAFPSLPIHEVVDIKIEFVPTPLADYTNDKSAMDAAVIFEDAEKQKHLIAIEVKYTDSLGTNKAADSTLKFEIAKRLEQFDDKGLKIVEEGCPQIYRNYLLAERYKELHDLKDSYSIILAPADHPTTKREIDSVKSYLKDEFKYKIEKIDLEKFVDDLELYCPLDFKPWLGKFKERYLNFETADVLLKPASN